MKRLPICVLLAASLAGMSPAPCAAQPAATRASSVPRASAPPSAPSADLAPLLARLGAPDFADRESATAALIEVGEPARPALADLVAASPDPELRTRAAAVLAELDLAARLGATPITLDFRDAHPLEVLEELRRQSGGDIRLPARSSWPDGARATVRVERAAFWSALPEVLAACGTHVERGAVGLAVEVGPEERSYRRLVHGPYLVEAVGLRVERERTRHVDWVEQGAVRGGGDHDRDTAYASFRVFAEPRLASVGVSQPRLTRALDGRGRSLLPVGDAFRMGSSPMTVGLPFFAALDPAAVAADDRGDPLLDVMSVAGEVDVTVATRSERLEVDDLASAAGRSFDAGPYRVEVRESRPDGDDRQWVVAFQAQLRPEAAGEVRAVGGSDDRRVKRLAAGLGRPRLLDARGREWAVAYWNDHPGGFSPTGLLTARLAFARTPADARRDLAPAEPAGEGPADPDAPGPPDRLVFDLPVETRVDTVPFEFVGLPLP